MQLHAAVFLPDKSTRGIYYVVCFSKQMLHVGKDFTGNRKKRRPRVLRLLSRVIGSRASHTYQPRAEALAQS